MTLSHTAPAIDFKGSLPPEAMDYRFVAPDDLAAIGELHRVVFGPGRYARSAFRIREMAPPDLARSIAAFADGKLIGAVLQSPVSIGGKCGAWLGPIAVTELGRKVGVGAALMTRAIARDAELGDRFVLLVGDHSYYGRFGFGPVPPGTVDLPGPADPRRLLGLSLTPLPILPVGRVGPVAA
jgi:predicted N-acetyltransferase YhbS